ncbi:MAG: hypothetical protein ACFFHV_15775 [Promethearchaeota archaeon]
MSENTMQEYFNLMTEAHKLVKYDPKWNCRRSKGSVYMRHNFKLLTPQRIECVDCGVSINLTTRELKYSIHTLKQTKLRELDKNKNPRDITIYALKIKKKYREKLKIKNDEKYIGQTTSRITVKKTDKILGKNRWIGHLTNIFNENHHNPILSNIVLKYCKNKNEALEVFEIMVLQIIKNQGDKKSTQIKADNAEKFWIGFFHTQFIEFGWNIDEGGYFGVKEKEYIIYKDLENAIVASLDIHWHDGPMEYLKTTLDKSDYIINNNIAYHYRDSYGEEVENYNILRKVRIVRERVIPLIEEGYNSVEIENHISIKLTWSQLPSLIKDVLKDPNFEFKKFRNKILIKKIRRIIRSGNLSYQKIAENFTKLSASQIETFIKVHMRKKKKEVLECYVKPKAAKLLRECRSGRHLLRKLDWLKESSITSYTNKDIDEKMHQIFGMSFKEAKWKDNKLRGKFTF